MEKEKGGASWGLTEFPGVMAKHVTFRLIIKFIRFSAPYPPRLPGEGNEEHRRALYPLV